MSRNSKLRATIGASVLAAVALVSVLSLLEPASAQSVVKQLISFACFDKQQCIKITNLSPTGSAIVGVAQNSAAMVGVDASKNSLTDANEGVLGTSANGIGVQGMTTVNTSTIGGIGTLGFDNSTTVNPNGGVVGISNQNIGTFGQSFGGPGDGIGVWGEADGNVGMVGIGGIGALLFGEDTVAAALALKSVNGGPLIIALGSGHPAPEVMSLDNAGNLTIAGALVQHGSPMSAATTSSGANHITYSSQQSVRTMEDVGEAQLAHGQAYVRLEPTFASAIDTRRSYLVFLTPQGDTNGLYIMQKTAAGFEVREHNGTSNVTFDYRIVAQPFGSVAPRMPLYIEPHNAAVRAAEASKMIKVFSRQRPHIR